MKVKKYMEEEIVLSKYKEKGSKLIACLRGALIGLVIVPERTCYGSAEIYEGYENYQD
jgi:hypothetical protein